MSINKTVQAVFDKAMYLIDAQNEQTGSTSGADVNEYRVRTIGILNVLLDAVYPASDTFRLNEDGTRPYLDDVEAFTDRLDLDARILREVLPYGLAAKLLSEENPQLANYFQQSYEEALARAQYSRPASFEDIEMPYGGIEFGEYADW
jgi:hypothetical protein